MIVTVLRLTRWEFFKLRSRWMPWILLGIVILITQFFLWGSHIAYHNKSVQELFSGSVGPIKATIEKDGQPVPIELTCDDILSGNIPPEIEALPESEWEGLLGDVEAFRADCAEVYGREVLREGFTLPSGVTGGIGVAHGLVGFLILILAASLTGAEYGWGTLRNALTRGVGRWQLLASKLLLLLLLGAAAIIVVSILIAVASVITAIIPPDETGGLFGSGKWSEAAVTFGKSVYGMAPFIVLATFLAVLTQSSSTGISLSLGYYVTEMIVTPIFLFTSWLQNVPYYLIGQNVNLWMSQAAVFSAEVTRDGVPLEPPGTLHAFLVLLAYIIVLGAATFWLFQRRDVTGAKGE